jgi:hypothetical protein
MQTAGGINEHNVSLAPDGSPYTIKGNRSRRRTSLVFDNVNTESVRPDLKLFTGCGAKRIGRNEDDLFMFLAKSSRQFGNRGGLSNPIYANHQDDPRSSLTDQRWESRLLQKLQHLLFQIAIQSLGVCRSLLLTTLTQTLNESEGFRHPNVRTEQHFLKISEQVFINSPAT